MERRDEDGEIYRVVVNHEEQHCTRPADRARPHGWEDAGKTGSRADCLEHVEQAAWMAPAGRPGRPSRGRPR